MKAMQTLKELDRVELETKLKDLKKEQFALRSQKSTGSLEKSASLGVLRKQIARVLTLLAAKNVKSKETKKLEKSKKIEGGEQ